MQVDWLAGEQQENNNKNKNNNSNSNIIIIINARSLFCRVAGEGRQAREQLEEDHPQRPPVHREAARDKDIANK